ncbi:MAG: GNAT family N-acetyltransferase, partial [Flavisolibacter sp.]
MEDVLNNPVYQALISGDRSLSFGSENVKYFDERVSPFAGFEESYEEGFNELSALLPHDRVILHARPHTIKQLKGWQLLQEVRGLQLVWNPHNAFKEGPLDPVPLEEIHIGQMIQLTTLTKPGPFGPRTIDFGHYFGIFDNEQLVAMAGQRLHVQEYTEISAVCTHPDHLG